MIRWGVAAWFALLGAPAAAQPHEPVADSAIGNWPERVPAAEATLADLQAMAEAFPQSGLMHLRVAQAAIAAEQPELARTELWHYLRRGGAMSAPTLAFFRQAFDAAEWQQFEARMAENLAAASRGETEARVGAGIGLVEGVVYIPAIDALVVSSVTRGGLFRRFGAGGWQRYGEEGAGRRARVLAPPSPMGMVFDEQRGWLWVASSVVDQTPDPDGAFTGLIGFGPGRNQVLRLPLPREEQPGDVALGPDGTVYIASSATGAVHARRVGDVDLERILAPGRLRSAQGMAVSPDGSALIISDYAYGLARLDLATGALDSLAYEGDVMLDGIDGLMRHRDSLIAIQNGIRPHGVLRIAIDPAGRRVTGVEILDRPILPAGEPTVGTIYRDELFYVANARWADFGEGGALNEGAAPRPTTIRRVRLR